MSKRLLIASGILGLTAWLSDGLHAEEKLLIADFETVTPPLAGTVTHDRTGADNSRGCAKLANSAEDWITAEYSFPTLERNLSSLSFAVKSAGPESLAVRLTDATGQHFQQRVSLQPDQQWHTVTLRDLTAGEIFDGAGDRIWHGPAKTLTFILEDKGTVWLDQIAATLQEELIAEIAARKTLLAKAPTYPAASFTHGPDGFDGPIEIKKEPGGEAYLRLSKSAQDQWASTSKTFSELKNDFLEFRFRLRTKEVTTLAFRLTDKTGQEFQQRLPVTADGQWQTIVIDRITAGESWGGANDRKWHGPAKAVSFIIEQEGAGAVDLMRLQAALDPNREVGALDWKQAVAGNLFVDAKEVRLPLESSGDRVEYTVTDFFGTVTDRGAVKVSNRESVILLPARNGYFLVKATARKGDQTLGERYTSYAVFPSYRVKNPAVAPWGVMTHFAQGMNPARLLPLLKQIGIVAFRDEHYWDQVEENKGVYRFPAYSEPYMAAAKEHGISPLVAMTFANPHYDNNQTPNSAEAIAAYGKYGQEIIRKFGDQIKELEVWNEYNGTWCNGPAAEDRAKSYARLIKGTYEKIKQANPHVKVLGCACVLIPLPYIEGIFKNGGLPYMDGVVIHPYRGKPEGVDGEVEELRQLIRRYNHGHDKEIWVTETGLIDHREYDWEKGKKMFERGRREIALYLPRQYILLLKSGCTKIFWYLASDHLEFVTMGLLRNADEPSGMGSNVPAPAAATYATLIRQLDGARYVQQEGGRKYSRARCYLFHGAAGEEIRTVWATAPAKFAFTTATPLEVIDVTGASRQVSPENGRVVLPLNEAVQYVRGKVEQTEEIDLGVRLLADSADDYSNKQGEGNWSYGWRKGVGGAFQPMTQVETMWGVNWGVPQIGFLMQSGGTGHPAGDRQNPVLADRRWTSPVAGEALIRAEVWVEDEQSDGVELVVLAYEKELLRQIVQPNADKTPVTVKLPVSLSAGMTLDFLFGPNGNSNNDSLNFHFTVEQASGK